MEAVKSQKSVLDVMCEWSRLLTQFHDDIEIDLREMDDKVYLSYAKQLLTEKNILSEEDTEQELLDYISLLRKRASFNGFDTIRLMCDEIEVQYYLQEGCTKKPLSGGFIRAFSDNDFSKRYLSEKSQSRQIGFSVRVQE